MHVRPFVVVSLILVSAATAVCQSPASIVGDERAVPNHLQDGQEFDISLRDLISYGRQLFTAMWTVQDGAGRPQAKGTGAPF